ncbi:wax ester/triacylglycerol synthase domain-containing protein [Sinomonas gamaensis]|uniref:wax ester/triacylglycerol synthase domain-containing protein n=1 Tax=Sinomonas gamaensis TaxID=2565624 RepID=UPI0011081CDB|nr:wax ester/triacylglycerol synthase domain-containing protein [Sinomonas gamaensis]
MRPSIDRVTPNDLTVMASDRGPVPMHMAAILEFAEDGAAAPDFAEISAALAQRIRRVPRLRRRLLKTPRGCGRPIWADDPDFSVARHFSEEVVADGREGVLRVAASLACTRLPADRPPWTARWIRDASGGPPSLVFVLHHAMADGLNGLAVLAALGDGGREPEHDRFPQPLPRPGELGREAWLHRVAALRHAPTALARGLRGLRELGLSSRHRLRATPTSFNRPTGPRRRIMTVTLPLRQILDAAHARGCTLNDLILVAVAGAMASVLRSRGESPGPFVVSVPISSGRGTDVGRLGNAAGVAPVEVPSAPDPEVRLQRVVEQTVARRMAARGAEARGTSAGPLGVVFRALARVGVFQRYIDRQRLVNTFLSNMRGPAESISIAGHRIASIVPITLTPGNVGVCFAVVSYAGELVVTVLADPDIVPDIAELTGGLSDELRSLTEPYRTSTSTT